MNIMDLFRTPSAPAAAPASTSAGTTPAGVGPNGTSALESAPAQAQGAAALDGKAPGAEAPPLEAYAKLFDNVAPAGGQSFQTLNADPAKIRDVAKTIDFTAGVSPELITKALAGDVKSMLTAMNQVAQTAFANSTQASSVLVDRQSSAAVDHVRSGLSGEFKKFQLRSDLQAENPAFSNPAIQPLVDVVQAQLASQYPQATVAELKSHAVKYLSGAFAAMNPEAASALAAAGARTQEEKSFGASFQARQQAQDNFDWPEWAENNPLPPAAGNH